MPDLPLFPRLPSAGGTRRPSRAVARSFDTGARVTARYGPVRETRTLVRMTSLPSDEPLAPRLARGFSSFAAYVRDVVAGASLAPYEVEAFSTDFCVDHAEAPAEPATTAETPEPAAEQPAPPAAEPPTQAPSAEDRIRAQWAMEDQIASARAFSGATPEERRAVGAIRRAAGQPARPPAPQAAAAAADAGDVRDGHRFFDDAMAAEFAYATTFDAGDVRLARRFAQMNELLDREEGIIPPAPPVAPAPSTAAAPATEAAPQEPVAIPVDDQALLDDLAALRDRLEPTAPAPPAATPPKPEPCPPAGNAPAAAPMAAAQPAPDGV